LFEIEPREWDGSSAQSLTFNVQRIRIFVNPKVFLHFEH
jgi:hypothetical protein